MSFTKLVEIPDKYRAAVPSDFVRDAQRVMKLMDPPGPMVECRPLMDADGQYVLPQWTVHYYVGSQQCALSFCAPFRYLRNLVTQDSSLNFLFGIILGSRPSLPSTAKLQSRQSQYEAAVWQDKIEAEKANPKDLSELV
mgnify:CR=1 FL=1